MDLYIQSSKLSEFEKELNKAYESATGFLNRDIFQRVLKEISPEYQGLDIGELIKVKNMNIEYKIELFAILDFKIAKSSIQIAIPYSLNNGSNNSIRIITKDESTSESNLSQITSYLINLFENSDELYNSLGKSPKENYTLIKKYENLCSNLEGIISELFFAKKK